MNRSTVNGNGWGVEPTPDGSVVLELVIDYQQAASVVLGPKDAAHLADELNRLTEDPS